MQSYIRELISPGLLSWAIAQKADLTHMTISRIRKAHLSHLPTKNGGRPRNMTGQNERKLVRSIFLDTAPAEASELFFDKGKLVSPQTVQRMPV